MSVASANHELWYLIKKYFFPGFKAAYGIEELQMSMI